MGVYRDPQGRWGIRFRRLHGTGRDRRAVRVPAHAIEDLDDDGARDYCEQFAARCESFVAQIEAELAAGRQLAPDLIANAESWQAITTDEATALRHGLSTSRQQRRAVPSLFDAAMAHPNVQRERERNQRDHARHLRELDEFVAWSGIQRVDQLRLDHVANWLTRLRLDGMSYDGRRHRVLYIRYAAAMGQIQWGIPDRVAGLRLDQRDELPAVVAWDPRQVVAIISDLTTAPAVEWRAVVALALGALMGLRQSEIYRLRVGDVTSAGSVPVIEVAARAGKNLWAHRFLPIPMAIQPWVLRLLVPRAPDQPLLATRFGAPFTDNTLPHFLRRILGDMPRNVGRKTFGTWAFDSDMDSHLVDAWMGHHSRRASDVSVRYYAARRTADQFIPLACWIDDHVQSWLRVGVTRHATTARVIGLRP